jgi:hypothetical protein
MASNNKYVSNAPAKPSGQNIKMVEQAQKPINEAAKHVKGGGKTGSR